MNSLEIKYSYNVFDAQTAKPSAGAMVSKGGGGVREREIRDGFAVFFSYATEFPNPLLSIPRALTRGSRFVSVQKLFHYLMITRATPQ